MVSQGQKIYTKKHKLYLYCGRRATARFRDGGIWGFFFSKKPEVVALLPAVLRTARAPGHPGESAARISSAAGSAVDRGDGRQDDHFLFFSPEAAPSSCSLTWLFFLSRTTVPSSISNSPWSFRHLTCGRVGEGQGSCDCFQSRGHHQEGAPMVSPGCRDSLVASCPA